MICDAATIECGVSHPHANLCGAVEQPADYNLQVGVIATGTTLIIIVIERRVASLESLSGAFSPFCRCVGSCGCVGFSTTHRRTGFLVLIITFGVTGSIIAVK